MEYKQTYNTNEERDQLCHEANEDGFRMLHDDFNPNWFIPYVIKHEPDQETGKVSPDTMAVCQEYFGTLTFTDQVLAQSPAAPQRDIPAELDEIKARVTELEKKQ